MTMAHSVSKCSKESCPTTVMMDKASEVSFKVRENLEDVESRIHTEPDRTDLIVTTGGSDCDCSEPDDDEVNSSKQLELTTQLDTQMSAVYNKWSGKG